MERSCWERALARAVTDHPFRARLLNDPAGTLADYGLTSQDRPLVDALRRTPTLDQLAAGFLHLAATAWALPTSISRRYVEDPFLTPYPSLAGQLEDRWPASVLVPLDQLPPATPSAHGITINTIKMIKSSAATPESATPHKPEGISLYRNPETLSRRPNSLENDEDDAVNF